MSLKNPQKLVLSRDKYHNITLVLEKRIFEINHPYVSQLIRKEEDFLEAKRFAKKYPFMMSIFEDLDQIIDNVYRSQSYDNSYSGSCCCR